MQGCKGKLREHVASLLPFRVLEAVAGQPLRISGVVMAAGISRNFNIYTTGELQSFAPLLVDAPVYVEHAAEQRGWHWTLTSFVVEAWGKTEREIV